MQAHIFQINLSHGGVPKLAVREVEIETLGIRGDAVAHPDIHGGAERALCLYSLERLLALQDEGHPVFPGALGENILVAHLDWDAVVPGVTLVIGESVRLQVTRYTTPCKTITGSFRDGAIERISHQTHPGWSRVYARVLQGGKVRVGERVEVGSEQ